MFKEILHNIGRHARAARVDIAVEFGPGQFRLQIRDDGAGFDPLKVRAGNGLNNLRRRAEDLSGTLVVDSRPGAGTTVTLTAPIT